MLSLSQLNSKEVKVSFLEQRSMGLEMKRIYLVAVLDSHRRCSLGKRLYEAPQGQAVRYSHLLPGCKRLLNRYSMIRLRAVKAQSRLIALFPSSKIHSSGHWRFNPYTPQ